MSFPYLNTVVLSSPLPLIHLLLTNLKVLSDGTLKWSYKDVTSLSHVILTVSRPSKRPLSDTAVSKSNSLTCINLFPAPLTSLI
uniref:Uncharacterized protein n=1 Tax=Caenorhabditis japonica TaxID=281687 RepID=A0A2Q4TK50_CAEJA